MSTNENEPAPADAPLAPAGLLPEQPPQSAALARRVRLAELSDGVIPMPTPQERARIAAEEQAQAQVDEKRAQRRREANARGQEKQRARREAEAAEPKPAPRVKLVVLRPDGAGAEKLTKAQRTATLYLRDWKHLTDRKGSARLSPDPTDWTVTCNAAGQRTVKAVRLERVSFDYRIGATVREEPAVVTVARLLTEAAPKRAVVFKDGDRMNMRSDNLTTKRDPRAKRKKPEPEYGYKDKRIPERPGDTLAESMARAAARQQERKQQRADRSAGQEQAVSL